MTDPAEIARAGPLELNAAAAQLHVSRSTLRRWIAAGAPVSRRGRRGRGGAVLVEPAAIAAWRAQAIVIDDASLRAFAARIPELLADAVAETFRAIEGPHKRPSAAVLAAAWYASTTTLLDALRAQGVDVDDPSESTMPEKIAHLRVI